MRVIAGSARSLRLAAPKGNDTRPTTDRIKETLFNMLQTRVAGSVVIDLFAGSGGLGLEALSRGAKYAYFIENNPAACTCIRENIRFTQMEDRAALIGQDALGALGHIHEKTVDLVFIDPPYQSGYEKKVLSALGRMDYIHEETLIILETPAPAKREDFLPAGWMIVKEKTYRTNMHWFIKRAVPAL